jgi:hypothetical protein
MTRLAAAFDLGWKVRRLRKWEIQRFCSGHHVTVDMKESWRPLVSAIRLYAEGETDGIDALSDFLRERGLCD